MSLPKIWAPIETVEVAGEQFTLRSITRLEQYRMQKMVESGAPEDELEVTLLSIALDTPAGEVRDWYGATPTWAVNELMGHIRRMSRLDEEAQKSSGE